MVKENKNQFFNRAEPTKQEIVSITYEEIGFFPRSFSRVLDRFLKQVFSDVENLVIQEYRFYRYLFLTTLKCLLILFFVPFLVNFFAKTYLVRPLTEYFWNIQQTEIFLNSYQQKRAFAELKDFEEKLYFESLIMPVSKTAYRSNMQENMHSLVYPSYSPQEASQGSPDNKNSGSPIFLKTTTKLIEASQGSRGVDKSLCPLLASQNLVLEETNFCFKNVVNLRGDWTGFLRHKNVNRLINDSKEGVHILQGKFLMAKEASPVPLLASQNFKRDAFEQRLQEKTIELAVRYNNQSIEAITNFFADLLSFLTLCYLLFVLEIQINITKSFLLEVFFGLDDSKKSLLILLITDLLVGYHSSNLWELFFEFLFNHYGLPESQTGIFLLVATLPVLLDVLFKYLIFRHLNRSSPATVATYHAMIE